MELFDDQALHGLPRRASIGSIQKRAEGFCIEYRLDEVSRKVRRLMKWAKSELAGTVVLLSLLSVGCGAKVSQDQSVGVLQDLPMMEIIQRVAPGHDRIGDLAVPGSSSSSKDGGRMIRHDEYSVDIGLKPHAVSGFASLLCGQLKVELESRGRILEGGESGPDGCSFHLVNQGVHGWVTVSPLLERGDRYWVSVIVDEW